jgi:hypothetical protein
MGIFDNLRDSLSKKELLNPSPQLRPQLRPQQLRPQLRPQLTKPNLPTLKPNDSRPALPFALAQTIQGRLDALNPRMPSNKELLNPPPQLFRPDKLRPPLIKPNLPALKPIARPTPSLLAPKPIARPIPIQRPGPVTRFPDLPSMIAGGTPGFNDRAMAKVYPVRPGMGRGLGDIPGMIKDPPKGGFPNIPNMPNFQGMPNLQNMPNLQGMGGIPGLQNIDFSNLPMGMDFNNFDPRAINANPQGFQDMIQQAKAQEQMMPQAPVDEFGRQGKPSSFSSLEISDEATRLAEQYNPQAMSGTPAQRQSALEMIQATLNAGEGEQGVQNLYENRMQTFQPQGSQLGLAPVQQAPVQQAPVQQAPVQQSASLGHLQQSCTTSSCTTSSCTNAGANVSEISIFGHF